MSLRRCMYLRNSSPTHFAPAGVTEVMFSCRDCCLELASGCHVSSRAFLPGRNLRFRLRASRSFAVAAKRLSLTAASDLIQSALLLAGTLAFLTNALATRGRTRLFWLLMSLGLAFWFAYQTLLWTYFEVFLRQDVPDVFWGDVILFLHIVPMMAALVLQPHAEQDERTTRLGSLDFSLLLVWWLYLYVFAVIPWQYAVTNVAIYQ